MRQLIWAAAFCFIACAQNGNENRFQCQDVNEPAMSDDIFNMTKKVQSEKGKRIDGPWLFTIDNSPALTPTEVTLPHRVLMPDCSFSYSRRLNLEQPSILKIRADDGARLFINGKNVLPRNCDYFPVLETGWIDIKVQVFNNAMAGGLQGVELFEVREYELAEEESKSLLKYANLIRRFRRLPDSTRKQLQVGLPAITDARGIRKLAKELKNHPLILGPAIVYRNGKRSVIAVVTDSTYQLQCFWGKDPDRLSKVLTLQGPVAFFTIDEEASFYYQIKSQEAVTPVYKTTVTADSSFSFSVWGDSQGGWDVFEKNVINNLAHADDFSVGLGDLVSEGCDESEWYQFINILSIDAAQRPYYLLAGNHDYDGYYDSFKPTNYLRFTSYEGRSYYSWYHKGCAFIALDPNGTFPIGISGDQLTWLLRELQQPQWLSARWKFVMLHQPPYSQGWSGYQGDKSIRNVLDTLVDKYRIDFVVSGHTHDFERLTKRYDNHQVTYIISGGGGGAIEPPESSPEPLMDKVIKRHHVCRFFVDGKSVVLRVYSPQNELLDLFRLEKN